MNDHFFTDEGGGFDGFTKAGNLLIYSACADRLLKNTLPNRPTMSSAQVPPSEPRTRRVRHWMARTTLIIVVLILFGWFYGWASTRFFPKDTRLGFRYGILHGALMPMALPSLVMGEDVQIYAPNNTGRSYKIGYIAGINACGLVFFGSLFWKPSRRTQQSRAVAD